MDKNKNMKGFIFTLDAVFSLIVASAAISILLYVHFTQPLAYQTPIAYTSTVLSNLLNTKFGQVVSSGITSNPIQTEYKNPYTSFGYLNQKGQTSTHYILVNDTSFNGTFAKNNAISLSAWVYELPNSECEVSLANIYNLPGTSGEAIFRFGVSGGEWYVPGRVMLELWNSGELQTNMFSSAPVQYNTWSYITAVYNGTYVNFYVNGVPAGSTAYSSTLDSGPSSVLLIGANPNSGCASYFPGYISNLQIYNTPLSNQQVKQLYTEGTAGAPVNNAGLVGWYSLNGNAKDYSGNNNNGVQHNVNFVNTSYVPIGNYNATDNSSLLYTLSELYLNNESTYADFIAHNIGVNSTSAIFINDTYAPSLHVSNFYTTDSLISFSNSNTLNIQQNITIAMWVKPKQSSLGNILSSTGAVCSNGYEIWERPSQDNGFGFGHCSTGGYALNNGTLVTGDWYFIVGTANATTISLYTNMQETNASNNETFNAIGPWTLGSGSALGSFNGSIANVQIYNRLLSHSQLETLYTEGIAGFPISGMKLKAWWPMLGSSIDYSGYGNAGVATNVNYTKSSFSPLSLSDAYLVSKSSSPMLLSIGNKSSIYNVSVVTWH